MSPPRIRCPSCAAPSAAIAVEYGHPDSDLFARAERGEVAIGGDVLFGGEPDWRCTACGHGFAGVTTDGGLRIVDFDDLEPPDYAAAADLLSERLERTRAVCEAVEESRDPQRGAGAALDGLMAWIEARYPLARPVFGLGAGLDRILVPRDLRHLADQLDTATDVCLAAAALWTAKPGAAGGAGEALDAAIESYVDVRDARLDGNEIDDLFEQLLDLAKEAAEPDDGWTEVRGLATGAFDVWVTGSEQAWARYAWRVLYRAGHTVFATQVERARVIVRLLALSVLYQEFCARAFDEGQPGEWTIEDPRIDPFVLGILAERDGVDADIEIGYDDGGQQVFALRELVRSEYDTVTRTLCRDLGQAVLFASLWASAGENVRYPLPTEVVGGIVNTDISDKMRAWEWIDSGMHLS